MLGGIAFHGLNERRDVAERVLYVCVDVVSVTL